MNNKSDIEVKREQALVKRTKDESLIKKKLKDHRKAVYDKQKFFLQFIKRNLMTIIVDYSNVMIASCMAFGSDFKVGKSAEKMESIARHVIISNIFAYKKQFQHKCGNKVIIATDGYTNWRKQYFKYYKAHRKVNREESDTDWNTLFAVTSKIKDEIKEFFPWIVLGAEDAEGDDVVAVMVKYFHTNECEQNALFGDIPQKCIVIGSDGDFRQLYKYSNYAQWNPTLKKAVLKPAPTFLLEKLLTGDAGDGIPSVLCPDDFIVNHDAYGRARSITQKIKDKFFNDPTGSFLSLEEQRNLQRNKTLIDFDCIPIEVQNRIIDNYRQLNAEPYDKQKLYIYMIHNKLGRLLENINEF